MVQKTEWSISESIRLIILGPEFNSYQSFGQWLKVLVNLTNLANLFSRNLGNTLIGVLRNVGLLKDPSRRRLISQGCAHFAEILTVFK